jgi:hypothetical protein
MAISLNQHRFGVTQEVVARFKDGRAPKSGLSSLFDKKTTAAKQVSIQVRRSRLLAAVDVQRCTDPNRNTFSRSTEKIFVPPFFSESFDFTECEAYDATFGSNIAPNAVQKSMLVDEAAQYITELRWKIDRAINKMYASTLLYGVVTMVNGDSIDFRRKAASMVVQTGNDAWNATTTSDPDAQLAVGASFLRDEGLSSGSTINVIMGAGAMNYYLQNDKVLKRAAIFNQIRRVQIDFPRFNDTTGLNYQGQIAGVDYIFNFWTYNDIYELPNGTKTKYIPDNMVLMVPEDFEGVMNYAGVPFVFGDQFSGQYVANTAGDYVIHDIIDQQKRKWDFIIESAPLPVPVSIDRTYTIQAY